MNKTIVAVFIIAAFVVSGCADVSNTKSAGTYGNEQYDKLVEKDKIIEVLNQLFIGTDNRDWMKVKGCFSSKVAGL